MAQTTIGFDDPRWEITGAETQQLEYKGKPALQLKNASAYLKAANFKDGLIEFDIAFARQRGFTGVRFRVENPQNAEEFYMRPHQSGQPDANQYCPVDNGLATWQLYHGPAYSVPYSYSFDQWFHVKLVVSGAQAEVYIDDMSKPALFIPELKRDAQSGGLLLYASMVPTYFANFSYQSKDRPDLAGKPDTPPTQPLHKITQWSVSSPFADSLLQGVTDLTTFQSPKLSWKQLNTEASGLANLGTITAFQPKTRNTVFAKLTLQSARKQVKGLQLGFSDQAMVYCNGQLLFSGNDTYRTRDFRYLGTIGYFDTVYLPLKKGSNEVWIAVTENFGGWGIQGKLEDMEGVDVVRR